MVPGAGIEPARLAAGDFESPASTNVTTRATQDANYDTGSARSSAVEGGLGGNRASNTRRMRSASSSCPGNCESKASVPLALASSDIAQELAQASAGFSGSEIEQVVIDGMYRALGVRETPRTEHLLTELESTRPLSVVMAEKIAHLRAWAKDRTVPAD